MFHRYTLVSGFDAVQADKGDSRYIAFMLEHWNTVFHGHARIESPLIFYPLHGTLGYSDALAGMGLIHIVLRSLGLGVFTAMNIQLVVLSLLSFAAAHWFMTRGFRLHTVAATVGAFFFAFCWPRFADLVHVQMQFTFVLPLLGLLALECLRDGPELARIDFAWRCVGFVALLGLTMATTVYFAEFAMVLLALCVAPTLALATARRHYGRIVVLHWSGLLVGAAAGALLAWPIAAVYLPVLRESGGRPWPLVHSFLLDPIDLLWLGRENYVWGWAFQHWHDLSVAKWPSKRVGVGLVATFAWLGACGWAVRILWRWQPGRDRAARDRAIAGLVILATVLLQLATLRFGDFSLWWLIWESFPGIEGIRAIGRVQLVAALPMGLAFAILVESTAAHRWPKWVVAGLIGFAAVEQTGMVQRYSGREAEALSRRVADAIPTDCRAAYIVGSKDAVPSPAAILDEKQFDGTEYLRANPDVAADWKGSPWSHYVAFGRAEHRAVSTTTRNYQVAMMYFYNYTIPLGATLAGIPVVNGLSGWQPPGWDLFDVFLPEAPQKLESWMSRNHRDPRDVCIVGLNMPYNSLPTIELWND